MVEYVERNRERMRYPDFRAASLCPSTGVVQAGCKVAIRTRCKTVPDKRPRLEGCPAKG